MTNCFKVFLDYSMLVYKDAVWRCNPVVSRIVAGEQVGPPVWITLRQGERLEPVDLQHPLSCLLRKTWTPIVWPDAVKSLKLFGVAYVWASPGALGFPESLHFLENRDVVMPDDDGCYRIYRDEKTSVLLPEKDVIRIAIPSPVSKDDGWKAVGGTRSLADADVSSLDPEQQKAFACAIAGVPSPLLEKRSAVEHKSAFSLFIQLSVKPLLTLLGDVLTAKLAKRFGDDLCIHWSGSAQ